MTKEQKAFKLLITKRSNDENYIFTPFELVADMVGSLSNLDRNILVVRNIEFVYEIYNRGANMENVYFSTDNKIFKQIALTLGIKLEHISYLKYDKEALINSNFEIMKFDIILSNPPYNPNSLWKKFVEKQIELLEDDGKMVCIHPAAWREISSNKKIENILKDGIEELHICDYENFKDNKVATKTDWYLFSKAGSVKTKIYFPNNEIEIIDLKKQERIFRFSTTSIPYNIINKLFTIKDNNIIFEKGFNDLYKPENHVINGKYKQCGGSGNGTGWTIGNFVLTDKPSKHQFEDKVVMSYAGKPRAQFFSKEDEIGSVLAHYWLTDNKSLPILLNSKMFWKLVCKIVDPDEGSFKPYGTVSQIPAWILRTLNFDGLKATTEEELYIHYGLTQEEIDWVNE